MRITVIAPIASGSTCVAAAILSFLRPKAPRIVAALERGQGTSWLAEARIGALGSPALVHCQSAERVRQLAAEAGGGALVLDKATDLRSRLRESWMAVYKEEKARLNLREPETIPVAAWVQVQAEMLSVHAACDRHDTDLIEIYGASPVYVELEDGGGVAETEYGRKAQGASSDGGRGASLVLSLDGGFHGNRPMGSRVLRVIKDAAGLCVGKEIPLPEFRDRRDRIELVHRLREGLGASLKVCREIHRQEVEAWKSVSDVDAWGAARRLASQVEAERLQEQVRQMLAVAGLSGNTNTEKSARGWRLEKAFGTGYLTTTSLKDAPVDLLREGVKALKDLLMIEEMAAAPADITTPDRAAEQQSETPIEPRTRRKTKT